jgi:hypothetical protein
MPLAQNNRGRYLAGVPSYLAPSHSVLKIFVAVVAASAFVSFASGKPKPRIPLPDWIFEFDGKKVAFGMSLTNAKILFPDSDEAKRTDWQGKAGNYTTLSERTPPDGRVWFVFEKDKLVEITLDSGTEGPTSRQKALDKWLVRTYGKGRRTREGKVWSVEGAGVSTECWSGSDTGDVVCSYSIRAKVP